MLIHVGYVGAWHGHGLGDTIANADITSKNKIFCFQEKWIKQSILFEQQDGSSV
jgi:hypothetical protein